MYSWEISQILGQNNYNVTVNVYNEICKSSQISRVKYEPFGNYFEIWAKDNYYWKFTVSNQNSQ